MSGFSLADSLHRLAKEALDSGEAKSVSEATELFKGFSLGIEVDSTVVHDVPHQIALLTAVALSRRVFLGGVRVKCVGDTPLTAPLPLGPTLGEAVQKLGGEL